MNTLAQEPLAVDVSFTDSALRVLLADGREISCSVGVVAAFISGARTKKTRAAGCRRCGHSLGSN